MSDKSMLMTVGELIAKEHNDALTRPPADSAPAQPAAGADYVVGVRKATDEMLSAAVAEVKRQDADETYDPANGRMWFEGYFNLREIIDAALAAAPGQPAPNNGGTK